MYTASSLFLKTLADIGITHVFVNWGSDHPALLEDLERQRVENGDTSMQIITCPNEMVALSAAQGYGQVVGKPAAVIVHVDVGTQAMAGAIHNADRSRTPILIYAGASPFSCEREHKGTRNEWIMWLQDIPDQAAIVRQYMRFTSQLNSALTIPNVIRRGLQFATSEPKGPVYLWGRREIMEEEISESSYETADTSIEKWPSVEGGQLSPTVASRIASALLTAQSPLIITSRLGQNVHAIPPLLTLSTLLAIPVLSTIPQVLNFPYSHPNNVDITYCSEGDSTDHLSKGDVILVIDSDLPWIPGHQSPNSSARIFVIDSADPLKYGIGYSHVPAELVCRAEAEHALTQLVDYVRKADEEAASVGEGILGSPSILKRAKELSEDHKERTKQRDQAELIYPEVSLDKQVPSFDGRNLFGVLRKSIEMLSPSKGEKTLFVNEALTNYPLFWQHMRPEHPGSFITSGGSSLGWSLGAAVGAYLGGEVAKKGHDLLVVVVGDGSYMFGVPSSAYWMARRYETPFLTIVLNNGGWNAPKYSMLSLHPDGYGSKASRDKLSISFGPICPDYAQIAVAASSGWAWGRRIGVGEYSGKEALESSIVEALKVVLEEKRCAVLDCLLPSIL